MSKIVVMLAVIVLLVGFAAACNSGLEARFTADPTSGYPSLDVQFSDESSADAVSWAWDFDGDGITDSTEQNPKYTYDEPGNYTVSLTAGNEKGNNTVIMKDYIKVIPCPRFADFKAEPTEGVGITTVQFTDMSAGEVLNWAWDFQSDGIVDSNERNPQHVYTRNGIYSVTLTITTPTCDDTITKYDYISITGCKT